MKEELESTKFYNELHNVIRRWKEEGDSLSVYEILGALEAVKSDVLDALVKSNKSQ